MEGVRCIAQKSKVNMEGRPLQSKKRSIWKDVLYRAKNGQYGRTSFTEQKTVNMEGRPLQSKKWSIWKEVLYRAKNGQYGRTSFTEQKNGQY
jgi:hypothetical protein